jgi:glycosyltransferase involved in cell wall biosynthesis
MNLPRITIITPSFNQAQYLPETIESILNQNYPNLEYTIIDGGSTDGSIDVIKRYERHLAYWVSEKDSGQSEAINKGFKKATGELFAWVNSDDVLFPGCLRQIAEYYVKSSKPDIITGNVIYIDGEGKIRRFVRVPPQGRFFFYRGIWHVGSPVVFFRSALFREVGGLNLQYHLCMDLDLWVRMMNANARVAHIKEYMIGFRWHGLSKSTAASKKGAICSHPEAVEIFGNYVPNFDPRKLALWRFIYKLYQMVNLNYVRACFPCRRVRGKEWWRVFPNGPAGSF